MTIVRIDGADQPLRLHESENWVVNVTGETGEGVDRRYAVAPLTFDNELTALGACYGINMLASLVNLHMEIPE